MAAEKKISEVEFAWRYAGVQRTLFAYIFSLLGNATDADDVMQETAAVLYEKAAEYDPDLPFLNWAMTFARFQCMKFRKYSARHRARVVALNDAAFGALANTEEYDWCSETERLGALQRCLDKLLPEDRTLLEHRYSKDLSVCQMAGNDERMAARLYKRLRRIREMLGDCVRGRLAEASQ